MTRLVLPAGLALVVLSAAGCGSSGSGIQAPTISAARTFQLAGFRPADTASPRTPTTVSFTVQQPTGAPLTAYRTGPGPHTGVHLIMVSSDLSTIIHRHPPVGPGGRLTQKVVFPQPGRYRVVVDLYPKLSGPQRNFQLFRWIKVRGTPPPKKPLSFGRTLTVDGYRFVLHGHPQLRAIQPAFLTISITDRQGHPAHLSPWYGALAHAIFFREGSLDYFHTHVCSPGATGCTSVLGPSRITGSSTAPGKLHVGVLVPVAGTWRLFLQVKANGHVVTAPFALRVQ
ncbi:MAG: hypothetical protein C5B48_07070 [Candidatus Rokuibacteriota bacterium]|nr:MAG: hypothetical protein C5B48_07070 [Candidatus Rokubacteria bacterium]